MLPTAVSFVRCVLFSLSFHVKIQRHLRIFSRGILFLRILETVLVSNQLLTSFVLACSNNCRSLLPNNDSLLLLSVVLLLFLKMTLSLLALSNWSLLSSLFGSWGFHIAILDGCLPKSFHRLSHLRSPQGEGHFRAGLLRHGLATLKERRLR